MMSTRTLKSLARVSAGILALFVMVNSAGAADDDNHAEYIRPHLAADGIISDDKALAAAAAACNQRGTKLLLPAGRILLTGAATITLDHCSMVGAGVPAGDASGNYGTTILLTSTTVPPFKLETDWHVSGINFFWPNQITNAVPYPPLFSDGGQNKGFNHGIIDNIVIVNAYDGMTTTAGGSSGDVKISNSTMWAYHHLFNLTNTGDSWALSNNRFTPGPLLNICGFSAPCIGAINAANRVNALFHITAGNVVTLVVNNTETYSWRYGILIDSGATLGGSIFDVAWDGMGTLIDSASGGIYAFQNNFTGSMSTCGIVVYGEATLPIGKTACFHLGINSGLFIYDFRNDGSQGSWLIAEGNNIIRMNHVSIDAIGTVNDGDDYYVVRFLAPTNELQMRNCSIGRLPAPHVHGIDIGRYTMADTVVQNNVFTYMQDSITGTTNNLVVLTGNTSFATSGSSVKLTGPGSMVYSGNYWDVAPTALLPIVSN